jgi:hypothetical protein
MVLAGIEDQVLGELAEHQQRQRRGDRLDHLAGLLLPNIISDQSSAVSRYPARAGVAGRQEPGVSAGSPATLRTKQNRLDEPAMMGRYPRMGRWDWNRIAPAHNQYYNRGIT